MPQASQVVVPKDRITVRDGRVTMYEGWCNWNGHLVLMKTIRRSGPGELSVAIDDPEHGGRTDQGPDEEVLKRQLHPEVAARYLRLFTLKDATKKTIRQAGFTGFEIVID